MIINYGFSIIGKSHINKGSVCQDSHAIKKLENGWTIAAVADGVGSAVNSAIGSSIAVKSVVRFCEKFFPWDESILSIKSMIRTAYSFAFKEIIRESQKSGNPIESYDTTLSMVIYDGSRIVYGHSGDGGIIGLNTFGDYISITKPQKGSDGISVIPLRFGDSYWVIDEYEEDLVAVQLVTDGMLDILMPYLLKNSINTVSKIYVPLASFFMDPRGFIDSDDLEKSTQSISRFVNNDSDYNSLEFYSRLRSVYSAIYPDEADTLIESIQNTNVPVSMMKGVTDDKTLVTLVNKELPIDTQPLENFMEPNWNQLQEEWNRIAYPHLYSDNQQKESTDNTSNKVEQELIDDDNKEKNSDYNGIKDAIKSIKKYFSE